MAKAKPPESVTITYDLFDLPTAQHKAGLAGLILQIRHMEGKSPKPKAIPTIDALTSTSATITFTAESVQCLFDDVYDATREVVKVRTKWAAPEVKPSEVVEEEIDEKAADGTVKKKKVNVRYFFHEQTQPRGHVLRQFITNGPDLWLKLWQSMLWSIPRGNPQSRKPFEERADQKPCGEGASAWADLLKQAKACAKNTFHTDEVAGSLWLGAQAVNAESIPFAGRVEQTLLLHFWSLTAQVYAPQMVKPDGANEFVGYVLAIPEVADLKGFLADYPRMLSGLGKTPRGYRPAEAVIDLPAEGALSFLEHLARLSGEKAEGSEVAFSLGSVEFLHLAKFGNNVKTLAAGRVAPRPGLRSQYLSIVGKAGTKPPYANPLFRRALMLALLNDQPWFQPFGKLFAEWDVSFFVPTDSSPTNIPKFWIDVRKKLKEVMMLIDDDGPTDTLQDGQLVMLVDRVIKKFLLAKAKKMENVDPKEKLSALPTEKRQEVYKRKKKVAQDVFYRARARVSAEFPAFFTEEVCSFGSYFDSKKQELQKFGTLLINPDYTETLRTLTLLSLSSNA